MRLLNMWTDDHLPCVSFEHEGTEFELSWTDRALIGRIELVEEGAITIEKAFKKYKGLLAVIQNPLNAQFETEEDGSPEDQEFWEEGQAEYQIDAGFIHVKPYVKK